MDSANKIRVGEICISIEKDNDNNNNNNESLIMILEMGYII